MTPRKKGSKVLPARNIPLPRSEMLILWTLATARDDGLTTVDIAKATGIKHRCLYTLIYRMRDKGLLKGNVVDRKGRNGIEYRFAFWWLLPDGEAIARAWHQFLSHLNSRQRGKIGWA